MLFPTQPGWYHYPNSRNSLIFLLNDHGIGNWYAATDTGEIEKCDPEYIAQGGELELLALIQ